MKIIDPEVKNAIDSSVGLRLDLGCGPRPRPGFFGVDHLEMPGISIVANLNEPLSELPDNCVSEIYTRHTLEHVTELLPLMRELHRVTRPDGRIEVVVPHFTNPYGYSDPTHVRFFGLYTFYYFADEEDQPPHKVPSFYTPHRFEVREVRIKLLQRGKLAKLLLAPLQWLVNAGPSCQDWYERNLSRWIAADNIRYVLRPKKPGPAPVTAHRAA
jgi:SAM-dependent methyltransferase